MAACSSAATPRPSTPPPPDFPALDVTTVLTGLEHPWDVATAPDGTILTGERKGRFVALRPGGQPAEVRADLGDLFASGETGLMAIALASDFTESRKVFTCQGFQSGDQKDVRVQTWTVDANWTELTRTGTLISGFPINSGRHGGCRILPQQDGTVLVSVGDSARPSIPQDLQSLGGKVLRVDATTGQPAAGNPFADSPVYTLGHRNVQGLALQPETGRVYAVEQGSSRDDEVNLLQAGGNYGWKPDRDPSRYDESVPMTDTERVPGAIPAVWSSGTPTIATASGTFTSGESWREWDGSLAVGVLKGQELLLIRLADDGRSVVDEVSPVELDGTYGRLRTVAAQPDGSLLVTTDNGSDDKVLRVTPR
nr:PQQ-dependent sugar dehydrogenase [Antrihabitans sp. YC2-6]